MILLSINIILKNNFGILHSSYEDNNVPGKDISCCSYSEQINTSVKYFAEVKQVIFFHLSGFPAKKEFRVVFLNFLDILLFIAFLKKYFTV